MHFENLGPLLILWPLVVALAASLAGFVYFERSRRTRASREGEERVRRYWIAEYAYRAKMKASEWIFGARTPRLTYQGPPLGGPAPARSKAKRRK